MTKLGWRLGMRIEDYVEEYKQILSALERVGVHDSDAARIILQERGRDRRMERIGDERRGNSTGERNEAATEKQKKFLDSLGIDYPADITKSEASRAISRAEGRVKAGSRAQ
ncbi:MAG: hypothetical protein ABH852_02930 [Methanobacteriota archaeon]